MTNSTRHDLPEIIAAYIERASLTGAPKDAPLFGAAIRKTGRLSDRPIHFNDICRMMKQLLAALVPRRRH